MKLVPEHRRLKEYSRRNLMITALEIWFLRCETNLETFIDFFIPLVCVHVYDLHVCAHTHLHIYVCMCMHTWCMCTCMWAHTYLCVFSLHLIKHLGKTAQGTIACWKNKKSFFHIIRAPATILKSEIMQATRVLYV